MSVTLQDIARAIEQELKLETTGLVIQRFRNTENMDLLKEALPYVSKSFKEDIEKALSGTLATSERCYA